MYLIYAFAYDQKREDMFTGWGVTLDKEYTKAVTLSDTYAVVDALEKLLPRSAHIPEISRNVPPRRAYENKRLQRLPQRNQRKYLHVFQ